MSKIHNLIVQHGKDTARRLVSTDEVPFFSISANILEEESGDIGFTYSGFCLTSLPHRKLTEGEPWVRSNDRVLMTINPGHRPKVRAPKSAADLEALPVPYGAKARLILLYLQTQAVRSRHPEVELGRSMYDWLDRMGIPCGGKTYAEVRRQAELISRCTIAFDWRDGPTAGHINDSFVKGWISFRRDADQGYLWDDTVRLSDGFFRLLTEHPVPVWEPALRLISGKSMALDVYVWLAYRLHVLQGPRPVGWAALAAQFGTSGVVRYFKPEFRTALGYVLAVYPEARVTEDDDGLVLHPSPPPIPERLIGRSR